jgi:ABC-type multidrug transport system fused ATPase/permease subunit
MDISRTFLKAAPNLGVNAGQAQNEMTRALQGQASLGDTLFVSLTRDTQAMAQFGASSQRWNALKPDMRIKLMTQALAEFSKDTAVLTARVNSLKGQFTIMKNNLFGPGGLLTNFGAPLKMFFINILKDINAFLGDKGKAIFTNLAKAIEPWLKDPKRLFAGLAMLQNSKKDLNTAGHMLGVYAGVKFAQEIMHWFGISLGGGALFRVLGSALMWLGGAISSVIAFFGGWFAVMNGLTVIISSFLAPLVLFYAVMQMISRAMAIAKINVLTKLANAMPMITESLARFSRIVDVFDEGMNNIAEILAPFFEFVMYPAVNLFVEILSGVSKAIMLAVSGFQGLAFAIMEFVMQIKSAIMGKGFDAGKIGEAFDDGVTTMIERIEGKLGNGDNVTKSTINMNVSQKFEFKQEMEPDRIAFTVKDQLLKIAQNPTAARGMTGASSGGRL